MHVCESTIDYIVNHYVKIWHVVPGVANNMHLLNWGGGHKRKRSEPPQFNALTIPKIHTNKETIRDEFFLFLFRNAVFGLTILFVVSIWVQSLFNYWWNYHRCNLLNCFVKFIASCSELQLAFLISIIGWNSISSSDETKTIYFVSILFLYRVKFFGKLISFTVILFILANKSNNKSLKKLSLTIKTKRN